MRGMRARDETVERFFIAHRFVVLARTPTEWVAGTVGGHLCQAAGILVLRQVVGKSRGRAVEPFMAFCVAVGKIKARGSYMKRRW